MSQAKQLPLICKPDAYTYAYVGTSSTSILQNKVPTHTNGYFQVNQSSNTLSRKTAFCKRPGIEDTTAIGPYTTLLCTNVGERIKGLITSIDKTKVVFITQDATKRYSNFYDAPTNALTQTDITANFSVGEYALTQFDNINYGANVCYAATNGTDGGLISSTGVWSKITDADYTGNGTKTNFVGLNGYLFYGVISGTNAGRIYNSDLSAAAAASGWVATSYISANDFPGAIVWLGRIRNFVVCFKQASIEFFEDVGNPTPGSPLEARKGLTKNIGCASASSIQYVSDGIVFVGLDRNGKQSIYKLKSDTLAIEKISSSVIDACLNNHITTVANFQSFSNDYESAGSVAKGQSQIIVLFNKELYCVTIQSYQDTTEISMVYDNELGLWYHWATNFTGADGVGLDHHFIPSMSFQLTAGGTSGIQTMFANNYAGNTKSKFAFFIIGEALSAAMQEKTWKDTSGAGVYNNYPLVWRSEHFDFGTNDRKFLNSIEVIYDSPNEGDILTTGSITLRLSRTPRNVATYVTPLKSISPEANATYGDDGRSRVKFNRLGSFRSAAVDLYCYGPMPIRIWAIEVVYSGGPQIA